MTTRSSTASLAIMRYSRTRTLSLMTEKLMTQPRRMIPTMAAARSKGLSTVCARTLKMR